MLVRTEEKITEVRLLGEKAVQIQTVGELAKFVQSLLAKGVDPNVGLQLDADFPTFVMRNGFLTVEHWSEDEVILGNLCDTRC
jgi:hypothetical protein